MYIFKGTDTSHRLKYNATGEKISDVYYELCNKGIISENDGCPIEKFLLNKHNKDIKDFYDNEEDVDYEKLEKWIGENYPTEEEFKEIIQNENGNAYYQYLECDSEVVYADSYFR